MKIAITSTGNTPEATIDQRFGRCSYFAIYDDESNNLEYIPNPNKDIEEGAGPASLQLVASKGVKKVISGEFGVKVRKIFDSLQIEAVALSDIDKTIKDVLNNIKAN